MAVWFVLRLCLCLRLSIPVSVCRRTSHGPPVLACRTDASSHTSIRGWRVRCWLACTCCGDHTLHFRLCHIRVLEDVAHARPVERWQAKEEVQVDLARNDVRDVYLCDFERMPKRGWFGFCRTRGADGKWEAKESVRIGLMFVFGRVPMKVPCERERVDRNERLFARLNAL